MINSKKVSHSFSISEEMCKYVGTLPWGEAGHLVEKTLQVHANNDLNLSEMKEKLTIFTKEFNNLRSEIKYLKQNIKKKEYEESIEQDKIKQEESNRIQRDTAKNKNIKGLFEEEAKRLMTDDELKDYLDGNCNTPREYAKSLI